MSSNMENTLYKLSMSKFRNSFKLTNNDIEYINKIGIEKLVFHTYDIINKSLRPKFIENDGKQTPMKGHPVFIAQHATATCCRGCLYKWHHIEKDKELSDKEVKIIVNIIMKWIIKQIEKSRKL